MMSIYDKPITKEQYAEYKKYYDLFATPSGKEIYADLLKTYYDRDSFIEGDPYATHYKDGQRSVVLGIKRIIDGIEKNLFKFQYVMAHC